MPQPAAEAPTVRAAKAELDRNRNKFKNTLHLMAQCLANRLNLKVATMMSLVAMPIAEEHSRGVHEFHTQAGVLQWHSTMADGEYERYLSQVVLVLGDSDALAQMGFSEPGAFRTNDFGLKDEELLASTMMDLVRHIYSIEWATMMMYTHRLPHKFAKLCHEDPEKRAAAIDEIQEMWEVLLEAEEAAHSSPFLDGYLASLLWPRSTWVRETCIAMAECGWARVPSDVRSEVQGVFRSQGSSLLNELGFEHLVSETRQSKQGGLGRSTRWQRLITSTLLENFDRKQPPIDMEAKSEASKLILSNKVYEAKRCNFSLGDDLNSLTSRQVALCAFVSEGYSGLFTCLGLFFDAMAKPPLRLALGIAPPHGERATCGVCVCACTSPKQWVDVAPRHCQR